MCVIAYKEMGVEPMSREVLLAMSAKNPDGFGILRVNKRNQYKVFKTMDAAEFVKEAMKITKDEFAITHCRIATHGSKNTGNCHPFISGRLAFAHNGILPFGNIGDKTDSESFFIKVVIPTYNKCDKNIESKYFQDFMNGVAECASSRFAMFDFRKRKGAVFGDWREKDGVKYSNMLWDASPTIGYYGGWESWETDDDDCFWWNRALGSKASDTKTTDSQKEAMEKVDKAYDDMEQMASVIASDALHAECVDRESLSSFCKKCKHCPDDTCSVKTASAFADTLGVRCGMTGEEVMEYVATCL